jgi:hypothetical protein
LILLPIGSYTVLSFSNELIVFCMNADPKP